MIKINYKKCCWKNGKCSSCTCGKACVGCVEACPVRALVRKKGLEYSKERCISCGACIKACKHKAISLVV